MVEVSGKGRDDIEQVDAVVQTVMENDRIPGISLAVVMDGKMVLVRGYGLANVELDVAATPETVYEIASVTKQFTAFAIMMLVEQGRITLDDKIRSFWPRWRRSMKFNRRSRTSLPRTTRIPLSCHDRRRALRPV
jgi:CubicO group peptidase (beta-lactamase class C family)